MFEGVKMKKNLSKKDVKNCLSVLAAISVVGAGLYIGAKLDDEEQKTNAQKASVISRKVLEGDDTGSVKLYLNLDQDPKTAEASVIVDQGCPTKGDAMLEQAFPQGMTLNVWAWKRLGFYGKDSL